MPRESICGEDYGPIPTIPLHKFLSDCSGPKEFYIMVVVKMIVQGLRQKISTAHLESPSCDQETFDK